MRISKETAVFLLKWDLLKTSKARIMCKEYGENEGWVEIPTGEWYLMQTDPEYKTFEIWTENVQPTNPEEYYHEENWQRYINSNEVKK